MCDRLAELRDAIGRYASSFDAALLSAEQAGIAVGEAPAIEAMAATVKGLAAARAAEGDGWKAAGDPSPAHHLARTTGSSVGQVHEVIETARRLGELPALSAAARAGQVSAQQAAAVADAAAADPSAEGRLLDVARRSSLGELREECGRTKAAVRPDAEARRRAIHAERFLRAPPPTPRAGGTCACGTTPRWGRPSWPPSSPSETASSRPPTGRGAGRARRPTGADPLAELARSATAGGERRPVRAPTKTIVRIDLDALLRGRVLDGEVCEVAGFGPVAVSAVRELLDTGDPFLAAVVTKGVRVVGVAHLGRRPNAHQQSPLEWLYPTCAVEGCSSSTWLENDHRLDWATSRLTVLDLLDRLCPHHHDRKSLDGWRLVDGHGKRPFVPPSDPRHPRHANAPPSAA